MPKLANQENLQNFTAGTFSYSAVDPGDLKEGEYTLVTFCLDLSYSTEDFLQSMLNALVACLRKMQGDAAKGIRPHPMANTIMIRLLVFGSEVQERIGLAPLMSIDIDDLQGQSYKAMGMTACADALINAGNGLKDYADELRKQDIDCNGLIICLTDGLNNEGNYHGHWHNGPQPSLSEYDRTVTAVRTALAEPRTGEHIESMCTILVGVNLGELKQSIEKMHEDCGFSEPMLPLDEADEDGWNRVADFFYQSVSSSSQARGTGTKSQSIANAI